MTTLIFDWSDWDGPASGHVVVTRRTWRRAPESLHVPWQVVVPVDGRATLDVAHVAGEAVSILWAPRRTASRTDHVLIPDGGEHLAHLLDRVDPSTLEPLPEDLPSAFDLVARAEESARVATATTATVTGSSQRAVNAADRAAKAATLSQEAALSVMPMLSGSVTITPEGDTLAVDLGQAVNVATVPAEGSAVDVIFPPVTTPDGRVNPDGLGTLLRVDTGADRLTWPGGTIVHGTPPEGQAALASLVRVGGAVTVVWPPDVVTSVGAGVTAQVAELERIIGGEVEVQPGGTVMRDAWPGAGDVPAVFVNPYSRPTSSELVLTVGKVEQVLFVGKSLTVYTTHRPGGLKDYSLKATVDLGTSGGGPLKDKDGWLVALAPGPAYGDVRVTETLDSLAARVPTSTLATFTDGTWGVVLQYNSENPHWEAFEWGGVANLLYDEKGNTAGWEHGMVLTSKLDLPLSARESDYASLGITLPGTFHRASELGDMGVYIG